MTTSVPGGPSNAGGPPPPPWAAPPPYPAYPAYPTWDPQNSAPVAGPKIASMGARFGGLVIDWLVVAAISIILITILGLTHHSHEVSCTANSCVTTTTYTFSAAGYLVSLLVGIAYSALLIGTQGRSLGHRATGIRVADPVTNRPIGPLRAGLRWLVMIVTGLVFTLGYWSPFFDDYRRRGWHDKASKSIVYSVR